MTPGDESTERPLRVGLVTPGFSASEADWCIPAQLDLVCTLAQGDDVRVFALRYPHEARRYLVFGAEVRSFAAAQARGGGQLGLWWRVLGALRLAQRALEADATLRGTALELGLGRRPRRALAWFVAGMAGLGIGAAVASAGGFALGWVVGWAAVGAVGAVVLAVPLNWMWGRTAAAL